jgi:RNA polymerase sigma-54 factor
MFLDLRQKPILTYKLVMTPQLQQAIKLLQLSRAELAEKMQQELAENPALEEAGDSKAEDRIDDLSGMYDYLSPYNYSKSSLQTETREFTGFETYTAARETLTEHLLQQLLMTSPTAEEEKIGSLIAGSLDKDGYLRVSVEEIAEMSNCETDRVAQVLLLMQTFDPPGVCARDLRECLLLQLRRSGANHSLAGKIISSHLDHLGRRDFRSIARALKAKPEDVISAAEIIMALEPRPGRQFSDEPSQYIEPDVFVFNRKAMKNGGGISKEASNYLRDKLRSAQWLIKSVHERERTIYRVVESILKFQHDFFEKGIEHLKPMVLRDVSEDIDMAESTVSRVTSNKCAHTPHGIFELKYFFTSHVKTCQGKPVSSTVVQEKIRRIVASENPAKPLSDERIAKILNATGIDIARRTVAKYRESLGILASSRRRRL